MATHDLSEITLIEGEQKIRLRKGSSVPPLAYYPPAPSYAPAPAAGAAPAPAAAPAASANEQAPPKKNYLEIKSPMVGTFYAKPAPDKPDYVTVGSKVSPATVVCKLEAMKIFNDLTAEVSGTIVEVCVKNGDAVDFGKVLFLVDAN